MIRGRPFVSIANRSAVVMAFSQAVLVLISTLPATAGSEGLFSETYKRITVASDAEQLVIEREADQASKAKNYCEASAKYLAAAAHLYIAGNFERARPAFDKAFLMAAQLSPEEQKQMLLTLSKVISNSRGDRDINAYKYFAQQRLKLLQKNSTATPDQRYYEVQTLALSCSRHGRFKEAISLLLDTLKDLESIKPLPRSYGTCQATLARVYDESGDKAKAQTYYERALEFTRQSPDTNGYEHVLQSYLGFLLKNRMGKEVGPIAEEYYKFTTAPGYSRWRDRVSYGTMAQKLAELNVDLANKYYRAAFENQVAGTRTAMNMGYGQTCVEWAQMLHAAGRTPEAIDVLQNGMAFCRSAKWPNAFERYMPMMLDPCEGYLRLSNRHSDADQLRANYEKEKISRKVAVLEEREAWLQQASSGPGQKPTDQVEALTELAYRAFDTQKCDEGLKLLKSAVDAYEMNADSRDSERMYNRFLNISARLKKCGHEGDSKALLLRIVRARIVAGFPDPDGNHITVCTMGPRPLDALTDLMYQNNSDKKAVIDILLADAKASSKPTSVIYFMQFSNPISVDERGLANLEEIEEWKIKANNPPLLFAHMLRISDWMIHLNQFDKAAAKWKQAVALAETAKTQSPKMLNYSATVRLQNVGAAFVKKNQMSKAADVYTVAYKLALNEPKEYSAQTIAKSIDTLASKYVEAGDTASGESLLNSVLEISRAERGSDSLLERMWLIKLADFFAQRGDKAKTKSACSAFFDSINKPGLTVSASTIDDMRKHLTVLKNYGFSSEASSVEKKLHELDAHQCK